MSIRAISARSEFPCWPAAASQTAIATGTPGVVVINQALAARLADVAGMKDPVGKMVRVSSAELRGAEAAYAGGPDRRCYSQRTDRVARLPDPAVVYVPLAQAPSPQIKLLVRTPEETAAMMPAIREAVREIDPNLPLGDVATMQQVRDARSLAPAVRPGSSARSLP